MKKISSLLLNELLKRNIIPHEKSEIYYTGIILLISDLINITLVIIAGIFTHSFLWSIIYLIMLWTVRRFSGGFHAKTYTVCRIVTLGTYIIIMFLSKTTDKNYAIISSLCNCFAFITMVLFAPVKHPNKSLTEKEAKANKTFSLIATLSCVIFSILLTAYERKEGLVISLTLLAIALLMYVGLLTNRKGGVQLEKHYR